MVECSDDSTPLSPFMPQRGGQLEVKMASATRHFICDLQDHGKLNTSTRCMFFIFG